VPLSIFVTIGDGFNIVEPSNIGRRQFMLSGTANDVFLTAQFVPGSGFAQSSGASPVNE
jgi:hypothetical protein